MFKDSHGRGTICTGKKEEPETEAKMWESVHGSVFHLRVLVLHMLRGDALGKNCCSKSFFNPSVQKQTLGEACFTPVLSRKS